MSELKSKYEEKFHVEGNYRVLKNWEQHAKRQIIRFYKDEEFNHYISNEVLSKDENPLGPFTRFLYWFGNSCQAGWDTMIGCREDGSGIIYLKDHYYKWMHKLRDELKELGQI